MANGDGPQDQSRSIATTVNDKLMLINSKPLPSYTASWGQNLARPTELPDSYDQRIDIEHIFVFSVHPDSGIKRPFYVTPRSCENCARAKQVCSRARPTCKRCETTGKKCVAGEGYAKLGGPKCEKPKLKKTKEEKDSERPLKKTRLDTDLPRKQTLRPRLSSKSNNYDLDGTGSDIVYESSVSAARVPSKKTVNEARKASDPGRRRASGRGRGRGRGRGSGRKLSAARQKVDADESNGVWVAADGTKWRAITSTAPVTEEISSRLLTERRPRIWVNSKDDLCAAMPELSTKTVNNVFWDYANLEPPIVFLQKGKWPENTWEQDDTSTKISLTFIREFTPPQDNTKNLSTISDKLVQDDEQDMVSFEDLNSSLPSPMISSLNGHKQQTASSYTSSAEDPLYKLAEAANIHSFLGRGIHQYPTPVVPSMSPSHHSSQYSAPPASPCFSYISYETPSSYSFRDVTKIRYPVSSLRETPYESPSLSVQTNHTRRLDPTDRVFDAPRNNERRHQNIEHMNYAGGDASQLYFSFRGRDTRSPCASSSSSSSSVSSHEEEGIHARDVSPPTSLPYHSSSPREPPSVCPSPDYAMDICIQGGFPAEHPSYEAELGPYEDEIEVQSRQNSKSASSTMSTHLVDNRRREFSSAHMHSMTQADGPLHVLAQDAPISTDHAQIIESYADSKQDLPPIPSELPPELKHLLECKSYNIPVKLIAFRDSALLPFSLPEQYAVVFLGFFTIVSAKTRIVSHDALSGTTQVAWDFVFKWSAGGENMNLSAPQPSTPWWCPANSSAIDDTEEPLPYTLLPSQLCPDSSVAGEIPTLASEVPSCRGWHCTTCGRLNVQRLLCFQQCATASCKTGNGQRAVGAMYVRDPHGMGLSAHPADRIPEGVDCKVDVFVPPHSPADSKAARVFEYTVIGSDSTKLSHVYTCNRPALQVVPNELFRDFQLRVPLAWQEPKTRLATGPYFTYLAGDEHEGNVGVPWSSVPECVARARELMRAVCRSTCKDDSFCIGEMTVLAWHVAGTRKGASINAHKNVVALMCLGADIELTLVPKCGLQVVEDYMTPLSVSSRGVAPSEEIAEGLSSSIHPMDTDDEEEIPLSLARSRVVSTSRASAAPVSDAKRSKDSDILISLVHGDMLILSGDEFEWSLKRTGMSILVIGLNTDKKQL